MNVFPDTLTSLQVLEHAKSLFPTKYHNLLVSVLGAYHNALLKEIQG